MTFQKVQKGASKNTESATASRLTSRPFAPIIKQTTSTPSLDQQVPQTHELLQRKTNLLAIPGLMVEPKRKRPQLIQAKLTIRQPGDKYKQEADNIAQQNGSAVQAKSVPSQELQPQSMLQLQPNVDGMTVATDIQGSINITHQEQLRDSAIESLQTIQQSSLVTSNIGTQVIQRVEGEGAESQDVEGVTNDSHRTLKIYYRELLKSNTFREEIHNIVTSERPIKLVRDGYAAHSSYNPISHTITVNPYITKNTFKSQKDISTAILFELHNAKQSEALKRAKNDLDFDTLNSDESKWKRAPFALTSEWIEWRNAAENSIIAQTIDQEIPDAVGNRYLRNFIETKKWLTFRGYLEKQVDGHTNMYDPDAKNQDWIGWDILKDVEDSPGKNALEITLEEFSPKVSNEKPKLQLKTNPFEWTSLKATSKTVQKIQPESLSQHEDQDEEMEIPPTNDPTPSKRKRKRGREDSGEQPQNLRRSKRISQSIPTKK
ncbi:hypothetical protein [Nostoc sp. NMS4]|uniref:hypothetical protein n=1 Tax=Nostoc sp. NMS4 TaxID=2815390 RepID=UPI0025F37154|nr:hypothetical protein [Nostoc sp. NMS4]MBN3928025.1 hypothetical protein [Nostoc sp. NMS4]